MRCCMLLGSGRRPACCDPPWALFAAAAVRVRRQYLPGLSVTFVEIGGGQGQNVVQHMAARLDFLYLD